MEDLEKISTGELGSRFIDFSLSKNFKSARKILRILYSRPYEEKEGIYKNIQGQFQQKLEEERYTEIKIYGDMLLSFLAFALG